MLAALALLAGACGGDQGASATPSPSPASSIAASPSPTSDSSETPVERQVLAPAQDLPVANLCDAAVIFTADGNVIPLLCKSGALNVRAWAYYKTVSASVLGLGLNPTEGQVEAALCDDLKHNQATRPEEASGYKLATAYYGWTFNVDVARLSCP